MGNEAALTAKGRGIMTKRTRHLDGAPLLTCSSGQIFPVPPHFWHGTIFFTVTLTSPSPRQISQAATSSSPSLSCLPVSVLPPPLQAGHAWPAASLPLPLQVWHGSSPSPAQCLHSAFCSSSSSILPAPSHASHLAIPFFSGGSSPVPRQRRQRLVDLTRRRLIAACVPSVTPNVVMTPSANDSNGSKEDGTNPVAVSTAPRTLSNDTVQGGGRRDMRHGRRHRSGKSLPLVGRRRGRGCRRRLRGVGGR